MDEPTCSTLNCSRPVRARGLCSGCYTREYRAGRIQMTLRLDTHSLTDVDTEARTAVCAICGPVRVKLRSTGGAECTIARRKHSRESRERCSRSPQYQERTRLAKQQRRARQTPEQRRAEYVRQTYGLSVDQLRELRELQGDRCAICAVSSSDEPLVIDHDHNTGQVRGLLCKPCNVALGWFRDDTDRIAAALRYLAA